MTLRDRGTVDDNSRLQVVGRRHPQRLGGAVAELGTLGDYIRALGGELKVIADFATPGAT